MELNKKASIILVLNVLKEYSDQDHFLTHKDILDKIKEIYGMELERKSIASSISILQDLDFDIIKSPKGGFALIEREFDNSEITFLVDAIFSSKSISGTQAKALTEKISNFLSKHDRKSYSYLLKSTEVSRTSNKQVFYNIELINEAIRRNKWIGFKYQDFDDDGNQVYRFNDYIYHASPCYLINNFGRYYFIGKRSNYDNVVTFRVDYMAEVYVMEERDRIDPKTLEEFKDTSISEYINDHIYMFGGKSIDVVMKLNKGYVVQYIYDWFGKKAVISKQGDDLIAKVRCNETAFFYWAMQYGNHIKILSPESMIGKVKDAASKILDTYKEE